MEKLTLWIKISSVAAVVSAVTLALIPESKLKNAYRTICTLIVVFSLFSAFASVSISEFDFSDTEKAISASAEEKSDELLIKEGEALINSYLSERLKEKGFDLKCKSELCKTEKELVISKVKVYGRVSEDDKAEITGIINENAKEEIKVIFSDGYD